ncbi:hypothetical protein [Sinorhizobium terangae]|uniref:hypothetical protein n=1 Tax=Sinorhizobium terangae TaxID=110322 RepID=UPI0024B046E2|nr:hypothetical protein [Sinorhizobium terangae]WFU49148.1 hypothetical protein QA637_07050 [Sinorhizobium terangae]
MASSMRIVRLSTREFPDLESVRAFFQSELPSRTPQGRFFVTADRIARTRGLAPSDYLVFTFKGRIVFTARSGSRLLPNAFEHRETHPYYFVLELDTLRETDVDVEELEHRYNGTGRGPINVATQGWNRLPASVQVDDLWAWVRG